MPTDALESHHALTLRPGALLADRFRIVRSLRGTSLFALSYHAEDQFNGDVVVIKEFFPRNLVSRAADGVAVRAHSPEVERDFLRALHRFALEGSVLAEIAHPNVVRVRAVVDANETAYLVMENHETQTLGDYVRASGGRLSTSDAGRVIQQLLSAIALLHAESIIHRDLSPRTVHIRADGTAVLLEFSARRHVPMHASDLAPGFAAFEQYGTRDIGPWTDVYAASALLYYLLTGVTPPSALERAAGEPIASPAAVVPGIPPNVARLVLRGMSLLPQQRPHAASELRRQLEAALVEGNSAARGAQAAFAIENASRPDETIQDEDVRAMPLRLAPGGIVIPGDERSSIKLLRKLGSAAARLRSMTSSKTPRSEVPVDFEQFGRREAPSVAPPPPRPPARASKAADFEPAVRRAAAPSWASPQPTAPLVAAPTVSLPMIPSVAESPVAIEEETTSELSLAAQLAFVAQDMDATTARSSQRRRYSLAAAATLVLAIGSSLVLLARSGRASAMRGTSTPETERAITTPGAPTRPVMAAHEAVDGGAVLQSVPRTATPRDVADSPAAKRVATPSRAVAAAQVDPPAEQRVPVLPATRLPNVRVAVGGASADLKIVPPELLVDERTRLTNGNDQLEQGDYAIARRTFRSALLQLDSVTTRYPDSQSIRSLRRELDLADARALQACTAENEMRKRRGEEARACQ